jgi:hypothetical protein
LIPLQQASRHPVDGIGRLPRAFIRQVVADDIQTAISVSSSTTCGSADDELADDAKRAEHPISVTTAIAASAVPIHQRRAEDRPRLIQASVPQRMPSVKNQVSLKTDRSFDRWNVH